MGVGLFFLLTIVALDLAFFESGANTAAAYAYATAVGGTGVLILTSSYYYALRRPSLPTRLDITEGHFALHWPPPHKPLAVQWDDPHLDLLFSDRSAVPVSVSSKPRMETYSVVVGGKIDVAMPEEAFFQMMKMAERRSVSISRNQYPSDLRNRGKVTITTIKGRR
jgi:hypothetical protein